MGSRDARGVGSAHAASAPTGLLEERLDAAVSAVRALACVEVDDLEGHQLQGLLAQLPRLLRQLEGVRARASAAAQRAEIRRRPTEEIGRILTDHQQQLGRQQRLSPSDTKRLLDAGRAAADHAATGTALRDGDLDPTHAQTIARVLADVPLERRADVEAELLDLARHHDPVTFGRHARAILGREHTPALARDERRQHHRRRFRAADTPDGGLAISGAFHGVAAEQIRVALRAFRRPDTPDEHRTPDQRGADAFEQLCATALRAGDAPTEHGVRPQIIVTMSATDLAQLRDAPREVTGTLLHSGETVTGAELRHLVADCQLVRLVLDADATPIEVSTTVRTVPVGLWRALLIRDRGCVWPGCTSPAAWCDVAHATTAYADDGKLSVDNAILLCRRHHRAYDRGPAVVEVRGDTVTFPHLDDTTAVPAMDPTPSTPGAQTELLSGTPPGRSGGDSCALATRWVTVRSPARGQPDGERQPQVERTDRADPPAPCAEPPAPWRYRGPAPPSNPRGPRPRGTARGPPTREVQGCAKGCQPSAISCARGTGAHTAMSADRAHTRAPALSADRAHTRAHRP